jgi:hypothetical protein
MYSVIPIDLSSSSNVFFNVNKTTCKLYVPVGSKRAYQNAVTWKDFLNILELMNLELFPGQSFSTWGYCWSNNGPLSGSIKEDPEVDWGDVSPKNFTSNSCTDIVPVQFAIKAPLKEGVYKTTLIDQSGIWPNAGIILNVTNSPQNFTAIRFGIYDDSITCRTRINYLPFNMNQVNNSCVSDYFPGNTITFGTKINPDVNWLKINPLSGTLTKNEFRKKNTSLFQSVLN